MLSRVAEHLYWMARYVERAENTARMVNVNASLLLDLPRKVKLGWEPLIDITGAEVLFAELYKQADQRSVVRFLIGDERNGGSMLGSLFSARENARTVRDVLPREAWEQVNDLYLEIKGGLPGGLAERNRYDFLKRAIQGTQLLTGLLAGSMSHNHGYSFVRLGRNLERADMTTRIIDVRSANLLPEMDEELSPFENIQWMGVLNSLSAYQMYRQDVGKPVRRDDVLEFLLKDRLFPRAFYHCVSEAEGCLGAMPRSDGPLRAVQQIQRRVTETEPERLDQAALHAYIDEMQLALADVHGEIGATYFRVQEAASRAGGA